MLFYTLARRFVFTTAILLTAPPCAFSLDLLPDLVVRKSDLSVRQYDTTVVPGRLYLRFSNGAANAGEGILHLVGVYPPNADSTVTVNQRIFRDTPINDSLYWERECGRFIDHPAHGHTHFEDWAVYRIREITPTGGVGPVVVSGSKVSFCILDESIYDSTLPNYTGKHFVTCDPTVQGLSVGCIDVYDYYRAEQWLDVTDIPQGIYWLESEVDPVNRIVESNEFNNVVRVPLILCQGPGPEFGIDSLAFDSVTAAPGATARVDIALTNSVPLRTLTVAFSWAGEFPMDFYNASVSGLRTGYFDLVEMIAYDEESHSAAYSLQSSLVDTIPDYLPAGTGPVLSVYFSVPAEAAGRNPIVATLVGGYDSELATLCQRWAPTVTTTGAVFVQPPCCALAGEADKSQEVTIGDAVFLIAHIFSAGMPPECNDAADADGNSSLDIGDAVRVIAYIFTGGVAPICGNTRR